jgi:7,8-dihydroneopterin aldolase/epimerase/oxygenase
MNDRILIRGLKLKARVGVTDEERAEWREVVVGIEVAADLRPAGRSDALEDTVDYARVIDRVEELVSAGEFRLLESMAEGIAAAICGFYGVQRVSVEVAKRPPVPQEVEAVAVRIERQP